MSLPRLTVAADSATAPFEQMREQIAGLIASGALAEGERLPTVRGLAADLGVAVNTVARAYRELEAEGWSSPASRAGTVVAPGAQRDDVALERAAATFAERAALAGASEEEALGRVRDALRRLRSEALNGRPQTGPPGTACSFWSIDPLPVCFPSPRRIRALLAGGEGLARAGPHRLAA